MPDILHRLTIDAPAESVHEQVATKKGLEGWWTGCPVGGQEKVGGQLAFYFGDAANPAAVMDLVEDTPSRVVWRCLEGPADWVGTDIVYSIAPSENGGATLLFSHSGWREQTEFMNHCSTHWASYLIGLKAGLEGGNYTPFPQGEVNHWP